MFKKLLILILLVLPITVFGDDYRIEAICLGDGKATIGNGDCEPSNKINEVEFLYPPKSNLKFKNGSLRSNYQYHFVRIENLSGDYIDSLARIDEARYEHDDDDEMDDEQNEGGYESVCNNASCEFAKIKLLEKGIVFRLDYKDFFNANNSGESIRQSFNRMTLSLLEYLARKGEKRWADTICQNIVEKIFEHIPIPNESSLSRFGFQSSNKRTVLLLSPKITLKVDTALKTEGNNNDGFKYAAVGQFFVEIFRRQTATTVLPRNRTFMNVTPNSYPLNQYPGEEDGGELVTLLANSGDIDLSKSVNNYKYAAFYEGIFKRNNGCNSNELNVLSAEQRALAVRNGNCNSDSTDKIYLRNSYLLFSNDIGQFYSDDDSDLPPNPTSGAPVVRAVYGERNLITPMISISINKQITRVPVSTQFSDLLQSGQAVKNSRLFRVYNGKYVKISGLLDDISRIILLPGDRIELR